MAGVELAKPIDVEKALAALDKAGKQHRTVLQIIESNSLCGPMQVVHAATLATIAHQQKRGRAKRLELEVMLYLSGKRQIAEAIKSLGVREGSRKVALIAIGSSEVAARNTLADAMKAIQGTESEAILQLKQSSRKRIQKLYEISDEELKLATRNKSWQEGLLHCVMEQAALLDAFK